MLARRLLQSTGKTVTILLLPVLVAGCLSDSPPHSKLPSSASPVLQVRDIDLHTSTMDITMPAGQPTALIVLNITRDMWVHPLVANTAGTPTEGTRNPTFWVVCPMVASVGLPETEPMVNRPTLGLAWIGTAFWLRNSMLIPALKFGATDWHPESDGPRCIGYMNDMAARDYGLAADEPFDGTLVIVLTVAHQYQKDSETATSPLFSFQVGVATRECTSNSLRTCPPEQLVPAEPSSRGGVTQLAHFNEAYDATCDACGFVLDDGRSGALMTGALSLESKFAPSSGLIYYGAGVNPAVLCLGPGQACQDQNPGPTGPTTVSAGFEGDSGPVAASCTFAGGAAVFGIGYHAKPTTFTARFDSTGSYMPIADALDIPIDIPALGWRVQPQALGLSIAATASASAALSDCLR